ncbi:hypothetical protein D3C73_1613550 [compost metagenome]
MQPILFGRLHEAVDRRARLSTSRRVGEQPILPANHERLYGALASVVVDLQPSVQEISVQPLPLVQAVGNGRSGQAFG